MNIVESVTSSWKIIARSKTRSFLTMLGIVIGVMAVIIVLSVGAGAQSLILNQVKSLGSNLIGVLPGNSEKDGPPASALGIVVTTLTYEDGQDILKNGCDCIESLAMYATGNDIISYGNESITTNYTGTTASYIDVEETEVESGHFFDAEESMEQILRDRHNIGVDEVDYFSVRALSEGLDAISSITDALKFFLVAISALALVVGGFGIMNIMLATVQERTQEIGLRKAVGAKSRDITFQFLIESVVITFVGGSIGIILGVLISVAVAVVAQNMGYAWDLVISPFSIILACGVSIGIGLIFGIVPANKASKLSAMEA